MDFIDHLIFTANTNNVRGYTFLLSDFAGAPPPASTPPARTSIGFPGGNTITPATPLPLPPISPTTSFVNDIRENFIFYQDPSVIDDAIQRHWFDMTNGPVNLSPTGTAPVLIFNPADPPPYHLIYSYLIENTRIFQIFERLIYLFQHDEILGVASSGNPSHQQAFQWIVNTENLFFKTLSNISYRNITSNLRPNAEWSRRNAYYRMFGMDLAFGEASNAGGGESSYYKAKTANNGFILQVEQFFSEVWQAYINAQNTSGPNTTDYQRIIDMAVKIREMLMARRAGQGTINLQNYRFMNLSKEEYASAGLMTWLFFIISYDSPLVNFLGCQANTSGERLMNIGRKVGIEAHKKSQALFDMAGALATILRQIEFGTFETLSTTNTLWIRGVIESQTVAGRPPVATQEQVDALLDLLTVINNWERATGHRIKLPESNITGTVRIQPQQTNGTMKPRPVMN